MCGYEDSFEVSLILSEVVILKSSLGSVLSGRKITDLDLLASVVELSNFLACRCQIQQLKFVVD